MNIFKNIQKAGWGLLTATLLLSACNKLELAGVPNVPPVQGTTPTLATLLDDPNFSILKAAVTRAGLAGSPTIMQQLGNPAQRFTVFAPDDAAFIASGIPSAAAIGTFPVATVYGIVAYHIVPQEIRSGSIITTFPNFQYPSILNPAPAASALLRLTTFPSVRSNGAWVNNIPITAVDITAVNGVLHKVSRIIAPPSTDLWAKISTDAQLTYLKAAIQRADSGVAAGSRLQDALDLASNPAAIGSNLTIFAPVDDAMKVFLIRAITGALMAQGLDQATAFGQASFLVGTYGTLLLTNPAAISGSLAAALSPTTVKGLLAYHIIGKQSGSYGPPGIRIFSVNCPTTATAVKTLLNSAIAIHPGIMVQATFVPGLPVVGAITVKGAANATASNVLISFTPPFTSDLHHINGVIHKIDQVLLPQ
jgi:uncharacterized surface protein with fasciclin (FAS1) repeats